ncbi:MAG: hypothetical protein JWM91_647 [Rhodospirillales bacterium]|nr:hypothetical protein [Rhodospirillales bacterium]
MIRFDQVLGSGRTKDLDDASLSHLQALPPPP